MFIKQYNHIIYTIQYILKYICFGFEHDWLKFREKIYEKYEKTKQRKLQKRKEENLKAMQNVKGQMKSIREHKANLEVKCIGRLCNKQNKNG